MTSCAACKFVCEETAIMVAIANARSGTKSGSELNFIGYFVKIC